ncbi:MAG: hypothetical protein IIB80_05810 [Thaumarchaeota archaeon]|nr:hypothetical protein [Nitrososphaerota archaeon]
MNTKLKQTGLIGVSLTLTLAMLVMVPGFIGEANAEFIRINDAVPDEPELDVELSAIQLSEPREVNVNPENNRKDYVTIRSDPDTETFAVVYRIQNDGTTDVRKVTLSVQSDTETVEGEFTVNLDKPKFSTIQVLVIAADPTSINAVITGYQIS